MLGVKAGVLGSPLTRLGALHVRPWSVLCTSWTWLYAPPVKSEPSYARYSAPVRGSMAGDGMLTPVRSTAPVFGSTSITPGSSATTTGRLQVRPESVERTISYRMKVVVVAVVSVYWMLL